MRGRSRSRRRPPALRRELEGLIRYLVDEPEEIRIRENREADDDILFVVGVDQDDLGKVIGRRGRTAHALRALLEARGDHDGRHYALEIRES